MKSFVFFPVGVVILFVIISTCGSPPLKVGTCFTWSERNQEKWEPHADTVRKILEIGERSYRVKVWWPGIGLSDYDNHSWLISDVFGQNKVVECPEALRNYK